MTALRPPLTLRWMRIAPVAFSFARDFPPYERPMMTPLTPVMASIFLRRARHSFEVDWWRPREGMARE